MSGTSPSHAGILERRDASGRPRYRVRVRRTGRLLSATLPTVEAALAWRAQAIASVEGTADPPTPPQPAALAPKPPRRPATIEDAPRPLCRGMVQGTIRTRAGRLYKPGVSPKYEEALRRLGLPRGGA